MALFLRQFFEVVSIERVLGDANADRNDRCCVTWLLAREAGGVTRSERKVRTTGRSDARSNLIPYGSEPIVASCTTVPLTSTKPARMRIR